MKDEYQHTLEINLRVLRNGDVWLLHLSSYSLLAFTTNIKKNIEHTGMIGARSDTPLIITRRAAPTPVSNQTFHTTRRRTYCDS